LMRLRLRQAIAAAMGIARWTAGPTTAALSASVALAIVV
jgi:hypothetical protein